MCLFPLSIRNPTKAIHNGGGQLLRMLVPCGHCAQCLQAKRNEWFIRTHYEVQRTFSLGGYVYFDTLTYDDAHLPKLSHFIDIEKYGLRDFSCFNLDHFKLFLKRLRRRIAHKYGIKKDAFRYFLTSEYGEDDRYTHRPHYHILFFVYVNIPPLEFSQLVCDCWQQGRTDGFPFKPATYVYQHVYGYNYGYGSNNDFTTMTSVCLYVSKYINKNSKFADKLNNRIKFLKERLTHYDDLNKPFITDESVELIKDLKRQIDMFHRQSQGFGLSYLDNLTPEKLMFIDTDQMLMRDKDKICKTYPLPMYYKRKLFYTQKKHADGSRYWELSNKGVEHILNAKLNRIDKITLKYMDIVRNCYNQSLIDRFFALLGNRDISDYVVYEQFYKGRHRHINGIDYKTQQQNKLTDEEINLNDWLLSLRDGIRPYACPDCNLQVDEEILRVPILKKEELQQREVEMLKSGHGLYMLGNSHSETSTDYINRYTFN